MNMGSVFTNDARFGTRRRSLPTFHAFDSQTEYFVCSRTSRSLRSSRFDTPPLSRPSSSSPCAASFVNTPTGTRLERRRLDANPLSSDPFPQRPRQPFPAFPEAPDFPNHVRARRRAFLAQLPELLVAPHDGRRRRHRRTRELVVAHQTGSFRDDIEGEPRARRWKRPREHPHSRREDVEGDIGDDPSTLDRRLQLLARGVVEA